jgi:Bacterial pre-peptidase C-terminal domain/Astacin (Peptidase family M12A)
MTDPIKICIDRILPLDEAFEAAAGAVRENPENVPVAIVRPQLGVTEPTPFELALITGKKWSVGRTLRIRFLGGAHELQTRVEKVAQEWSQYANINLQFGVYPNAELRIAFEPGGSWSYVGTDALAIGQSEQTMNFGWLTPTSTDDELGRVVRHEMGHALGAIHEHQSPAANIPWDREAVYRYYSGPPNNWTRAQIDQNIFQKYSGTMTNFSAFDRNSIMLYAIPNELTLGDYEVGWNRVLSMTDKEFMSGQYPGAIGRPVELTIYPPQTKATIGQHGEQDVFTFLVTDAGQYTVETDGPTDVVMTLLGPDDQSIVVAQDDDGGRLQNARINTQLNPGQYYVRVRHFLPTGTGDYEISVHADD